MSMQKMMSKLSAKKLKKSNAQGVLVSLNVLEIMSSQQQQSFQVKTFPFCQKKTKHNQFLNKKNCQGS